LTVAAAIIFSQQFVYIWRRDDPSGDKSIQCVRETGVPDPRTKSYDIAVGSAFKAIEPDSIRDNVVK
jgi:hypothetical protein